MKSEIINWVQIKGMGYTEILITISIDSEIQFDSIEWIEEEDQLILHKFVGDDLDYEFDWDDLPTQYQATIYYQLIPQLLN